jgi:hypothetical protein
MLRAISASKRRDSASIGDRSAALWHSNGMGNDFRDGIDMDDDLCAVAGREGVRGVAPLLNTNLDFWSNETLYENETGYVMNVTLSVPGDAVVMVNGFGTHVFPAGSNSGLITVRVGPGERLTCSKHGEVVSKVIVER